MSDELVTWLRAQLDEDERVARNATWTDDSNGNAWRAARPAAAYERLVVADGYGDGVVVVTPENGEPEAIAEHIARHNPARVLAEVEAKRRILEEEQGWVVAREINFQTSGGYVHVEGYDLDLTYAEFQERFCVPKPPSKIVKLLALPYADRPGYQEAWRP